MTTGIPKNIAIIMDGNGRWATLRGRPRIFGHIKGARVAKKISQECSRMGVQSLILYAFSTENWLRPKEEVNFLMELLRRYLKRETTNLVKENIKFSVIGEISRLPIDVLNMINYTIEKTAHNTGMNLVFAISYGSRQEITSAIRNLAEAVKAGTLAPEEIDEARIEQELQTFPLKDPDLIIRTSGEERLSNFLLWQAAYSEFLFTDILWPDFEKQHLLDCFKEFATRQRRFGKVAPSENPRH